MSNMNIVYKLLTEYDFEIKGGLPDDLKCGMCSKILIDACQSPCGCCFCHKCVDQYLARGGIICPGTTEECKLETLENVQIDYKANKQISKLVVICPEDLCNYESELSNLVEHLRLCAKKSVKCPFYDLGCNHEQVLNEKMNDHLCVEIHNHCKIMVDIIGSLKNEVAGLKKNDDLDKMEIKILKEKVKRKSNQIESLKVEFISMKASYDEQIDILQQKMEEIFNETLNNFKQNLLEEIKLKIGEHMNSSNDEIEQRIISLEIFMNHFGTKNYGTFVWDLDRISERRESQGYIWSDYFYAKKNQYKMRLHVCANGSGEAIGKGLSILLCLYPDENDNHVSWPFQKMVNAKITNKSSAGVSKCTSKICILERPFSTSYIYDWNYTLDFIYDDLYDDGLIYDDKLTIEFTVHDDT